MTEVLVHFLWATWPYRPAFYSPLKMFMFTAKAWSVGLPFGTQDIRHQVQRTQTSHQTWKILSEFPMWNSLRLAHVSSGLDDYSHKIGTSLTQRTDCVRHSKALACCGARFRTKRLLKSRLVLFKVVLHSAYGIRTYATVKSGWLPLCLTDILIRLSCAQKF